MSKKKKKEKYPTNFKADKTKDLRGKK